MKRRLFFFTISSHHDTKKYVLKSRSYSYIYLGMDVISVGYWEDTHRVGNIVREDGGCRANKEASSLEILLSYPRKFEILSLFPSFCYVFYVPSGLLDEHSPTNTRLPPFFWMAYWRTQYSNTLQTRQIAISPFILFVFSLLHSSFPPSISSSIFCLHFLRRSSLASLPCRTSFSIAIKRYTTSRKLCRDRSSSRDKLRTYRIWSQGSFRRYGEKFHPVFPNCRSEVSSSEFSVFVFFFFFYIQIKFGQ